MTTKSFYVCLYLVQAVLTEILEDLDFLVYMESCREVAPSTELDDLF